MEFRYRLGVFGVVVLLIFSISNPPIIAQPSVTLLDTLDHPHGVSPQNTKFSACWGWVSPDGKEYAIIGTYLGTSIIDLNVSPIREVAFIQGNPASYCYHEFKTYRQYLYIVSEGGRGVQIVDLSQLPDTAILVREFQFTLSGKNIVRSHSVTLADGYLYLNGSSGWSPGGCVIFSLRNDPTNPEYVGQFEPQYIHDAYVRNDTLYGAAIYSGGGLYVVNVQDKASPVVMRKIEYTGSGTHHAWATLDGRYALTTDEIGTTASNLKIWDMQNLGAGPPYTPLATYSHSPSDLIHNVHGRGKYAFISHYTAGMWVVDVSNPAAPVEVGGYDSYPGPGGSYGGCWDAYPYFPSGRWIGSDMQTGLYLLSFDLMAPRIRSSLLSPANGDTLPSNVNPAFLWRLAANQTDDPHYYEVHLQGPGVDTLLKTRDTTLTVPYQLLQEGGSYSWHIWIKDEFTQVSSQDTLHFVYGSSATGVKEEQPAEFFLAQNYPNPFNPNTVIEFNVQSSEFVTLNIHDVLGRKVATLLDEKLPAGTHKVDFDASTLASGVYYYRLRAGDRSASKKMILMK